MESCEEEPAFNRGEQLRCTKVPNILSYLKRNNAVGNALLVQWLGLCPFTAEEVGSICGWGTKIPKGAAKEEKKKERKKQCYECMCVAFKLLFSPITEQRRELKRSGVKEINQSILKEINPEYLLEGLMLKLQYFGRLMPRVDSLEKSLMQGKIEGQKEKRAAEDEMAGWHH